MTTVGGYLRRSTWGKADSGRARRAAVRYPGSAGSARVHRRTEVAPRRVRKAMKRPGITEARAIPEARRGSVPVVATLDLDVDMPTPAGRLVASVMLPWPSGSER
jgi:hypothetical protein